MRLIDADALEDALGSSDRDIYCKEWIRDAPTIEIASNDGWIAVNERLPVEDDLVLILCKNKAIFVGACFRISYENEPRWRIKTALNSTKLLNKGCVTHWMPLPKPPEDTTKQ